MRVVDLDRPVGNGDLDFVAFGPNARRWGARMDRSSEHAARGVVEVDLAILKSGVNHCWPPCERRALGECPGDANPLRWESALAETDRSAQCHPRRLVQRRSTNDRSPRCQMIPCFCTPQIHDVPRVTPPSLTLTGIARCRSQLGGTAAGFAGGARRRTRRDGRRRRSSLGGLAAALPRSLLRCGSLRCGRSFCRLGDRRLRYRLLR